MVGLGILFFKTYLEQVVIETPDTNINGLKVLKSENLILLDDQKIKKSLTENNAWIKDIRIEKKLPQTLLIKIKEREQKAYIESLSSFYEISEDGTILGKAVSEKNTDIPIIQIEGLIPEKGDKIPEVQRNLISLVVADKSGKREIMNSRIDLKSQIATIELKSETNITIPLYKIDPTFPTSLQTIIERFRIEGKDIAGIDFRFEKPIITFK